ncbi:HI1506-related protein [Photobacterium sanguinicancri]|uniref:HI1506-related protein n=1 Tax=Photobacterium sanguinicancri TaxID=875932 RepID=A0AAW7Y829_9GAMM|nr:HI1506-related protein [Photobacterium sanguinicancri]MDO6542815.1 HI1506-related protein [Photobacterium sanguinicancri]
MAQQTVIAKKLVVQSLAHGGYRRAGMAFNTGENVLEPNTITCSQLAMLEADPRLAVSCAEASSPDGASGNLVQGSVSDGVTDQQTEVQINEQITLISAISQLDPENPDHFTTGNKPQVDALSKLVGHSVTASQRDDAWADYQKLAAEQADNAE